MSANFRWRKFSPIDRRYPIFELLDGEAIVLDVTRNDESGRLEIAFHEALANRVISLDAIEEKLAEVRKLLADEDPI